MSAARTFNLKRIELIVIQNVCVCVRGRGGGVINSLTFYENCVRREVCD